MRLTRLFREFFNSEKSGGFILIIITVVSLLLANSPFQEKYINLWHAGIGGNSILHWINDGLMTLFFLLIGLELEREIYDGELSNIKKASLPFFAAIGGMMIPAAVYVLFNLRSGHLSGAGIPTATDIAFAIGILSLLGRNVPGSLKIFLTALAVIDDLGAIIIISVFYSSSVDLLNLSVAIGIFVVLFVCNRLKVRSLLLYILGGIGMWYFMEHSGVHATISGVMLAFAIPFGGGENSPSYRLQHYLHKPVPFLVLPLFAAANTAIVLEKSLVTGLISSYGLGIVLGLIIGKPLGIWLLSYIAVRLRISELPYGLEWKTVAGIGMLGGIGFTMSIFIALLAFNDPVIINNSKLAILVGSLVSGISGYFLLRSRLKNVFEEDQ